MKRPEPNWNTNPSNELADMVSRPILWLSDCVATTLKIGMHFLLFLIAWCLFHYGEWFWLIVVSFVWFRLWKWSRGLTFRSAHQDKYYEFDS